MEESGLEPESPGTQLGVLQAAKNYSPVRMRVRSRPLPVKLSRKDVGKMRYNSPRGKAFIPTFSYSAVGPTPATVVRYMTLR